MSKRKSLVYLTGFMGSGKSTIGPILANVLGYDFIDLDEHIEEREHRTVSDIFAENGEGYFRELEKAVIEELKQKSSTVISLGGGTITKVENLETIKSTGVLVYLKSSPQQIFRRMRNRLDRPLLRHPDGRPLSDRELMSRIQSTLALREVFYKQADVVVSTDGKKVGITVDEIARKLRRLVE